MTNDANGNAEAAVAQLRDILDLHSTGARTTEDIFTGDSQPMRSGRIFGGQVLAQAIVAAARTLPEERIAHSMHGYFLRPGDASEPVTFAVDRIHDGRSFSTRRAQAFQRGVPIFSMIASFQDESPGVEHEVPAPAGIPSPEEVAATSDADLDVHPLTGRAVFDAPVELRHVSGPIYLTAQAETRPQHAVWMRVRRPLPDDPAIHRAILAYLSDLSIQETILRAHGLSWSTPGLNVASLDHAMWWHRPARTDEWLLYVLESPSAQGGRGLSTGRFYTRDGALVASTAQEIMVRVPAPGA
ncbi:acyl-CoA thioesterase II [Microbacterium sp. X-17]|uniref:acyl-CoA thioesterase n=1 Tax=Microbacterium sp. X-17 TaxID=3144404 RepID=UPI0031F59280